MGWLCCIKSGSINGHLSPGSRKAPVIAGVTFMSRRLTKILDFNDTPENIIRKKVNLSATDSKIGAQFFATPISLLKEQSTGEDGNKKCEANDQTIGEFEAI